MGFDFFFLGTFLYLEIRRYDEVPFHSHGSKKDPYIQISHPNISGRKREIINSDVKNMDENKS